MHELRRRLEDLDWEVVRERLGIKQIRRGPGRRPGTTIPRDELLRAYWKLVKEGPARASQSASPSAQVAAIIQARTGPRLAPLVSRGEP